MFAVIRIRGSVDTSREVEATLKMLKLNYVNNCVIIPEDEDFLGMLRKVKDYITWGKIDKQILIELLKKRGRLLGDKAIDEKGLKKITKFESFDELSDAIIEGKVKLKDLKEIKPVFKLNSPKHGLKAKRLPYPRGALGDRKDKIKDLLMRMV
jgi:large subunit ribosomal protein L30